MAKKCNCGEPVGHAKAVESGVFQCLQNAIVGNEDHWRRQADLIEGKFTTEHGMHYSCFLYQSV